NSYIRQQDCSVDAVRTALGKRDYSSRCTNKTARAPRPYILWCHGSFSAVSCSNGFLTYGSSRLCRAAQFVAAGDQVAGHKSRLLAHADRAGSIQPILADSALNRCLVLAKPGARLCLRGLLSGREAGLRQQLIQHALGNQALGNPPAKTLL